jgi:hypothetical protein
MSTAAQRAAAELRRDPARSDRLIADQAACDHHVVSCARRSLEQSGAIPAVPRPQRAPRFRNGPRRGGRALSAAALYPRATPRELAARFGLPYQSAWWALREQARRQQPQPAAGPRFAALPKPPDFSRGLCTTVRPSQRSWWTSSDTSERQAAARMCAGCPVLEACRAWSLALPWSDRDAVYAGMSPGERARRKREALAEFTKQALRGYRG